MKIPVTYDIPEQDIADLMISAIEGNHMVRQWCEGIYLLSPKKEIGKVWYADPEIYAQDFKIQVCEILEETLPSGKPKISKHNCSRNHFIKAFTLMALSSSSDFSDFRKEDYDIFTADVFLQYVALGEVKYG